VASSYVSLRDFAAGFAEEHEGLPDWVHPDARTPAVLEQLGLRHRVEDILDTVVALQRAERLQNGVFAGPSAMSSAYRDVLQAARTLRVAVPPAILAGTPFSAQGCFGTDGRAFLYLSTFFFGPATEAERLFMTGRLCGHIAARQVTAGTLYALLADQDGLRKMARRGVGPMLEVVLAPLSVGVRLALSRWHRAAEISADRAGLLVCRDVTGAARALLRQHLGKLPDVDPATYLRQHEIHGGNPSRFAELLSDQPFSHKRIRALELFARSEVYAQATGIVVDDPLTREALDQQTARLLGVS